MVNSAEITDLKRIVAKNPKSLAFAWLADLLRMDKKLDEALLTANTGLEANYNFLPGRLARGRILLEKGDLAGARADFEAVAEQDSFCSCAQKLYLETSEKLGLPVESEIYQKILGTLEPGIVVKVKVKTDSVVGGVNAALDDLLSEDDAGDDKEDNVISDLLLQTFTNIFEPAGKQEQPADDDIVPYTPPPKASKPASAAPDLDSLINEQLKSKVEDVPDLTGDMDSLLASASSLPPVSGALTSAGPPDLDSLINEQLKSKVEDLPDLTGDIDSLLASAPAMSQSSGAPDLDSLINEQLKSKVEDLPDLTGDMDSLLASAPSISQTAASAPDLDSLINEQLKSKVEDLPDLTGDIDSLLASAPSMSQTAASAPDLDSLINEQLKSKVEDVPDLTGDMDSLLASAPSMLQPAAPAAPDLDSLINEQLKSKVEDAPDLTGDMDSLLASASDILSASGTLTAPSSSPPDIDSLVAEQLTSRVDNMPDLTGDISSLLSSMPAEPSLEPSLAAGYSFPPITFPPAPISGTPSPPSSPTTPDIDALINEQLKSKVEDVPDLTGDISSLLASNTLSSPNPPDLDALINEQLSSKVEDVPDLTGDIDSLLASAPTVGAEPELMPYVPPTDNADPALAQKPTMTLAELYMDQGLPQKAAGVYKELLMQDPNNADLKAKLAIAEKQM
ncbi:MAG: hypothetical protein LBC87_00865 [Fibromonadaceae bacterium]|nr:hypothetical protein [Fibromonadaceae bacterium]